ncbi:MAG TPA: hypothetical protein VEI49_07745, partial [Terriglobales bacterium]|nr:hypothetical protein [Terriglobales bacterium]
MRFHLTAGFFVLLLCSSFALAQQQTTTGPTADGQPSQAVVHFYRYKQFVGSALAPSIFCDGTQLARMENGRYFSVKLA